MRTLILAVLLFVAPAAAQPQKVDFTGEWHGTGLQTGPGGVQSTWTIELRINADRSGAISYPSLDCRGVLRWVANGANRIVFREEITKGACIDDGRVEATLVNGRIFWFWTKHGVDIDASAVLYLSSPIA